jgi:hypothetical protein
MSTIVRNNLRSSVIFAGWAAVIFLFFGSPCLAFQQVADPDFKPVVAKPAYPEKTGPTVAIDEAHANFHTAGERYKPFADLLRADGYTVVSNQQPFSAESLQTMSILVIANAGSRGAAGEVQPAFTDAECDAIYDWVRDGGCLLLIADHAPFGSAAANLGERFGVSMGKGWVFDRNAEGEFTTQLVSSRENGLLGDHPIVRGREDSETVQSVRAFTGQSLTVPEGAAVLMQLGEQACEAPDQPALNAAAQAAKVAVDQPLNESTKDHATSVAGRAQGVALEVGNGRVVIMAEAGMFSAQVATIRNGDTQRQIKMGMNVEGNDNQQFALNLVHWLSRLL